MGAVLLLKACACCDLGGFQLQSAGCFEFFDSVGLLPGEVGVFSAEVTVGCRLFVDGATQVQVADDCARAQVEGLFHGFNDFVLGNMCGAKGVDHDRQWLGNADGVGQLDFAAVGQTGGDHVLGDPARGIRGGTVDLGAVLATKGAAAVTAVAAVGVDDDLAAGEARVAHGAAHDKATGGVHVDVRCPTACSRRP